MRFFNGKINFGAGDSTLLQMAVAFLRLDSAMSYESGRQQGGVPTPEDLKEIDDCTEDVVSCTDGTSACNNMDMNLLLAELRKEDTADQKPLDRLQSLIITLMECYGKFSTPEEYDEFVYWMRAQLKVDAERYGSEFEKHPQGAAQRGFSWKVEK